MNLALLRRDDALRGLPLWGVPLLLNACLMLGLVVTSAIRRHSTVSATALAVIGWLTVAAFLALGPGRSRCRPFDLALPISARTLWLTHLAAVTLAALAVAAGYVAAVAILQRVLRGTLSLEVDLPTFALNLAATTVLATILLQIPRPSLARPSFTIGYAAWAAAIVVGLLALLAALGGIGPLGGLALLALAAGAAAVAHRSVPAAFAIVGRAPQERGALAPGADATRVSIGAGDEAEGRGPGLLRASLRIPVVGVTGGAKELVGFIFVVLVGLFLGGVTKPWESDAGVEDLRFAYLPLASYLLFTLIVPRLAVLHHFDPLPFSRRRLFLGLTLPVAMAFVASFGVGAFVASRSAARIEYVDFSKSERDGRWSLSVPLRVYQFSWDGRPPTITSPWGESHPAESIPLVRGLPPVVWNPFSAPPGSSAKFVALQVSRAAQVVYGAAIAPEAIESRWLETRADGAVVGRGATLPLRVERPDLAVRSGPVFPVLMALMLAPWLLVVAILLRTFRAGLSDRIRRTVFWGIVGIFVATMLAMVSGIVASIARPWLARALIEIPSWAMRGSAIGIAATWVVSALLTFAAYRVAENQFRRMEIPTKPLCFGLLERLRGEVR